MAAWVSLDKRPDQRRHEVRYHRDIDEKPYQSTPPVRKLPHPRRDVVQMVEYIARHGHEIGTGRGRCETFIGSHQQLRAERILELAEPTADYRGRDMFARSRTRDGVVLDDSHEQLQGKRIQLQSDHRCPIEKKHRKSAGHRL